MPTRKAPTWRACAAGEMLRPSQAARYMLRAASTPTLLQTCAYLHMVMASAAAVASSSREALARGMPVRSPIMVWKLSSDSRLQRESDKIAEPVGWGWLQHERGRRWQLHS